MTHIFVCRPCRSLVPTSDLKTWVKSPKSTQIAVWQFEGSLRDIAGSFFVTPFFFLAAGDWWLPQCLTRGHPLSPPLSSLSRAFSLLSDPVLWMPSTEVCVRNGTVFRLSSPFPPPLAFLPDLSLPDGALQFLTSNPTEPQQRKGDARSLPPENYLEN